MVKLAPGVVSSVVASVVAAVDDSVGRLADAGRGYCRHHCVAGAKLV
jgi:hypothetical protein